MSGVALLPASILALMLTSGGPSGRQQTEPPLRIGLVRALGRCSELDVGAPGGVRITTPAPGNPVQAAGCRLAARQGRISVAAASGELLASGATVTVAAARAGQALGVGPPGIRKPSRYRGAIEVGTGSAAEAVGSTRLRVVNVVDPEEYLRGVVPCEMPASAGAEALRAQAVVARTYAARLRGAYARLGYDLTDTTQCQVYGGVDAECAATDAAVRDTAGMVVSRRGRLFVADYYDDCGGMTAPGDGPGDFPPAVVDADSGGVEYCARGSHHRWTLELPMAEIASRLASSDRESVGPVVDLQVVGRDGSGRALAVRVVGERASREFRGARFRAMMGYDRVRSTLFTVERGPAGVVTLRGKGNGHGHGLCQSGAMGLAAAPYLRTCAQILQHYFPGAEVGPLARLEDRDGSR